MNFDNSIINDGSTDKLDAAVTAVRDEIDRTRVAAVQAEHTARSAQQESQDARLTADDAWNRSRTAVWFASAAIGMSVINIATLIIVALNN